MIVAGDELTIDYSEIAGQVKGPINSGWFGGGQTTARVAFKYLMDAGEMANEGTFRPLKLVLPPGKILSADATAPMGNYSMPFPTVIDAVIKALEQALPARVPGGHFGTHSGIRFYGRRADGIVSSAPTTVATAAGAPARPMTAPGRSAPWRTATPASFRWSCRRPISRSGSRSSRCARIPAAPADSAAGLASARATACWATATVQTNLDRTQFPPWGVHGGKEAKPGRFTLVAEAAPATQRSIDKEKGRFKLAAGDLVCVETGGGGGYGDPRERALAAIQRDLDAGYVFSSRRGAAITEYDRSGWRGAASS